MRELNIDPIRSVERAIQVLNCFSFEQPVLTIDEIMKKTKLAKATTYRLLWTLEKNNLVQYDQRTNEYRLGIKHIEYGGIVVQNLDISREAEPCLLQLHEATGHSVILAIPQGESVQYLLRYDSNEGLQPNNYVGRRRILHNGALGIILLAYMEESFVENLLAEHPLVAYTPKTETDPKRFIARLKEAKEQGYYIDVDGTFIGYTAIAAPIFQQNETVCASVGISGANYKMEGERRKELIELLLHTAQEISERIGYVKK